MSRSNPTGRNVEFEHAISSAAPDPQRGLCVTGTHRLSLGRNEEDLVLVTRSDDLALDDSRLAPRIRVVPHPNHVFRGVIAT